MTADEHRERVMGLAEQWVGWDVPIDEPFRELKMYLDDANRAYQMAAANRRAGNPDVLCRFDLMHLEEAAESLLKQCLIESAALFDPSDGAW